MQQVTIEPFRPEDVKEVASVIAAAMVTNPTMEIVFQDVETEEIKRRLTGTFELLFQNAPADTLVARKDGKIISVVRVSRSPHCIPPPSEAIPMLEAEMKNVLKESFQRHEDLFNIWRKNDLPEPHYHFGPNAVLPEFQGQGIATEILTQVCERIDSEGEVAFLETDKPENVKFYSRFGFSVINETTEPFGVTTYFMKRMAEE